MSDFISQNTYINGFVSDDSWVLLNPIEKSIKEKIERLGTPLKHWDIQINYGIKTGFNEAFIIGKEKRDEIVLEDPKSAEIIRPLLRGRDIKRYNYDFADLWLINVHNGVREKNVKPIYIENYPAIKNHLDNYYNSLEKRLDKGITPYNLRNCTYMDDFSKQKIVWGEISDLAKFAIELEGNFVCEATSFLMIGNSLEYLTCFLNSKLSEYLFSKIGTTTGVGTIRWKKYTIQQMYVPKISKDREIEYIKILKKILEKDSDIKALQNVIDYLIFEEVNLSLEEIEFIKLETSK